MRIETSNRNLIVAVCVAAWFVLPGCGSGRPKQVAVSGEVTHKGQPVEGANVVFLVEGGRPAMGITDAAGRFTLTTFTPGDGALPGEHIVTVVKQAGKAGPEVDDVHGPVVASPPLLPPRYASPGKTPLRATVAPRGKNDFTFDLTD